MPVRRGHDYRPQRTLPLLRLPRHLGLRGGLARLDDVAPVDGRDQVGVIRVRVTHLHVSGRGEPRVVAEQVVEHSVL